MQKGQRADSARSKVIIRLTKYEFLFIAKNIQGAIYAKSLKEKEFFVYLIQKHKKKEVRANLTIGSKNFRVYYLSKVELLAKIVILTLLQDIIILIEDYFITIEQKY